MRDRLERLTAALTAAVLLVGVFSSAVLDRETTTVAAQGSSSSSSRAPDDSDSARPGVTDRARPTSTTTTTKPPTTTTTKSPTTTTTAAPAPPPTTAPTAPPTTSAPPKPAPTPANKALCIGDSVMKAAGPAWRNLLTACHTVDAVESRQFYDADATAKAHAGSLGKIVVVHLGTNGNLTATQFDELIAALPGVERIVIVNLQLHGTRSWEVPNNTELRAGVKRCGARCVLAEWKNKSEPHPEWFGSDGIHLTGAGAQAYANLIAHAVAGA